MNMVHTCMMWNPMVTFSFLSVNRADLASDWESWTMISAWGSSSSDGGMSKRYWGLSKKVSGWLRHPPAMFGMYGEPSSGEPRPRRHDPKSWVSFQVLDKENTEVLINRHIDISVKWVRKSSNGILCGEGENISSFDQNSNVNDRPAILFYSSVSSLRGSTYQKSPSSSNVSPSFSFSLSEMFVHSGDLESSLVSEHEE